MKVLCNQQVENTPLSRVVSCKVALKASAPQERWFVLWRMAPEGGQEEIAWSKAVDFYAFSWGVPRKPA